MIGYAHLAIKALPLYLFPKPAPRHVCVMKKEPAARNTHTHNVFVYSFSDNYIASWEFDLDEEFTNFLHPLRRCFGQNKTPQLPYAMRQSKQVSTVREQ